MNTSKSPLRVFALGFALSGSFMPAVWPAAALAANLSGADMVDYTAFPVTTLENVTPQVMLTMSRDHQYFSKAYNDYTDLDNDGIVDTTYDNSIEYYGYFDPDKCYSYTNHDFIEGISQYDNFRPQDFAVNHYCDTVSGEWSGNFLNWATMTRMDIVRKILYGGFRRTDTPNAARPNEEDTVLERAHLPTDTHSFAKYYNGDDLGKLTPFNGVRTDNTNGGDGDGFDDRDEGLTMCNTTTPASSGQSHDTTNLPVMRIAEGNFALWGAGEVFECHWKKGSGLSTSVERGRENGNNPAFSGIDADDNSPEYNNDRLTYGGFGPDFNVIVEVCNPAYIDPANNNENCKQYPNLNYKPTGLLQEYGEDESIHFGLMTGSFENNTHGGVLRKNIGPIDDEIDPDNGAFNFNWTDNTATVGIIRTLDQLRIFGYRYGGGDAAARYFQSGSSDDCGFQQNTISDGECFSWGNPISEIYAESIRYFAGLSATPSFDATDDNFIEGIDEASWVDPLNADNFCAALNTVVFNASLTSYDHDDTSVFADIPDDSDAALSPNPVTATDAVGDAEGISGNDYFVGRNGVDNDEFCTGKTVTNLGNVRGICPEGPTVDGTFQIAGMAYYAHTNDLRPSTLEGRQVVDTYAVQLATNVPKFELDADLAVDSDSDGIFDNDADVTILPAYRLVKNDGGGTLVDFKIVQKHVEVTLGPAWGTPTAWGDFNRTDFTIAPDPTRNVYYGKAMVQWEDSEQGGDFDMDQWGVISYFIDLDTQEVTVVTDLVFYRSNNGQLFGFIIAGTEQDGFHAYSGGGGGNTDVFGSYQVGFEDPYDNNPVGEGTVPDCSDNPQRGNGLCYHRSDASNDLPRSHTFSIGGSGATLLPDPLLLAAKYGAFDDRNDNGIPDLESEFDIRDENGIIVPGGDAANTPDTYFFVTNPAALEQSLRAVFNQIIERVASGTAAAVVASEQEGTGAVFQALYDPVKADTLGNEASWIGTLHAIFVDPEGFLREDTDNDDQLDGYDVDKVIEIFYDDVERRARLRRFDSSSGSEFNASGSSVDELINLNPIWNAREQLSALSNVTTQRSYTALADTGRHILTWVDGNYDNLVATDGSELVSFDTTTFDDNNFGWLDIWDGVTRNDDEADKLINYIRGAEQSGYRTRTVDYDGDGTAEIMRLGDIVHSTPTVQGSPAEAFDLLSFDASYAEFRVQYRNRRNVVYVGANDGMIHAINAGFFDVNNSAFVTSLNSEVAHPLGSELWAYIPKNLLGHLQWLKDEDYTHVYYSDLKPLIFDAKIFDPNDADHPHGWGTVLVVGMRLGGGHDGNGILLDTEGDGYGASNTDSDASDDVQTKSAYVVLDITNPEEPPQLIAELSPPGQYLTTSFPAVALIGTPDPATGTPPTPNKWYLLFGSGPTDLGDVESSQSARLFAYDLEELVDGTDGVVEDGPFNDDGTPSDNIGYADTNDPNTFVGELTVSDQNLDMMAEAVYFGTVGLEDGTGGNLFRLTIDEDPDTGDWEGPYKLLDVDKPFSTRPSITIDEQFRTWVIAGTGRLYTNDDKESTETQRLYGFLDLHDPSNPTMPMDHASFIDVTDARTFSDGSVDMDNDGSFDTTFEAAITDVAAAGGWVLDYEFDPLGSDPSERTVSNQTLIGGIVLSSAFTPSTELCGAEGESRIIGRAFNNGLVPPLGIFGQACFGCPEGNLEGVGTIDLGAGLASSPSIHIGNHDVPGKVTVIVQQSTGAITGNQAQTLGGLNNGEVSWQEFRTD